MTLVVRGGTLAGAPSRPRTPDIVIEEGVISALAPAGTASGDETIDVDGLWVLPGMVDAHVHFDEPGREDWEGLDSGSAAAAAGGVTTVVDMPIDCDPPTVTAAAVAAKAALVPLRSRVDVALWGGLVPQSVGEMAAMAEAGVCGFKAFACPSGWDEFPAIDEASLDAGLRVAAGLQLPVAVHCELERLGHSVESEVVAIAWAAERAAAAGAQLHVVHVSSAAGVDAARRWPGVWVETCAHYLLLTESGRAVDQCFPPLRPAGEQAALLHRVRTGAVDTLASDHSPCPPSWRDRWAGIDGAGMTIPLLLACLGIDDLVRLTTRAGPLLRLPGKGAIAPGYDADLALVDPTATWSVSADTQWSRHKQSPYLGRQVIGRVMRTLVRGRTVFDVDNGPCPAGGGHFIRPYP